MSTLTYAYAESKAVIGPLIPTANPHSWDLCALHAARTTAPLGWELVNSMAALSNEDDRDPADDGQLTALAQAVAEAGTVVTGLITDDEPDGGQGVVGHCPGEENTSARDCVDELDSHHPSHRAKRPPTSRYGHLRLVPDPE